MYIQITFDHYKFAYTDSNYILELKILLVLGISFHLGVTRICTCMFRSILFVYNAWRRF